MESVNRLATERLATEHENQRSSSLDALDALSIVTMMNQEDATVATSVEKALPQVAEAVERIVRSLSDGGRLIYVGAGTSGRLGVLDAAECPPTFSTDYSLVQACIAGGRGAMFQAVEGLEDREEAGEIDLQEHGLTHHDVVVGISASGRTPYVMGALRYAKNVGSSRVALSCNQGAAISRLADTAIEVVTGAEVLSGSTRLKAGTAQKMVLNMLSTAVMVRLGKVYKNLMVDLHPSNAKLVDRACRILMTTTDCDYETAHQTLVATNYRAKLALVMLKTGLSIEDAARRLEEEGGFVRKVLDAQA